jgi:hypothetical protein
VSRKSAGSVPTTVIWLRVFLLASAVLALAGCGGKSEQAVTKTQYEQRLDGIGRDLYKAANALGQSTATQIFIDGVDKLQTVIHDAANELDGVRPPGAAAKAANHRLVRAFRDLEDEFEEVKAARRESFPRAVAALQRVQRSAPARETVAAAQRLRTLGFKVPVTATIGSP